MTAPPRVAEIDLGALEQNLRSLSPQAIDVRANAYGHGTATVLRCARELSPGLRQVLVSREEMAGIPAVLLDGLEVTHADEPSLDSAALYGLGDPALTPVMTLKAQVVLLKPIAAGQGVSYGASYRPDTDTTMALVAIGYSQGVARQASNRCDVFVAGAHCRIAGAISMDLISVDVGELPVRPGDHVEFFGQHSLLRDWSAATRIAPLALTSRIQTTIPRIEVRA
ncbi:MAG: alanine racemase [Gulosibacter sp.]|uniref:alanine racemase n=1 Tax=Gulosibacter sp. TaxID=2817531 RepID=UPI003F90E874